MIKALTAEAEVGKIYTGTVRKIVEFGAFVEIFPGTDGLVHISELSDKRVKAVSDVLSEGDEVMVKVISVDRAGKIRLSRKEALAEVWPGRLRRPRPLRSARPPRSSGLGGRRAPPVGAATGRSNLTGRPPSRARRPAPCQGRSAMAGTLLLKVTRVGDRGPALLLPRYETEGSAGLDLRADEPVALAPGERALVPTGLSLEIPPGHEGQVRPRSGLAARHGVTLLNTPGTVDSDYRGEVKVILVNLGQAPVRFERGERIAQLVIAPVTRVTLQVAEALGETGRGAGGFGSTGR